jgi:hypothetical protein
MKSLTVLLSIILTLIFASSGCTGKGGAKKESADNADTTTVADTGFTGIKKYMSQSYLIKEVTFKNGVRQGLMKTFYQNGKVRQTFWYENGFREDSSRWYYMEGQLFRTTPYIRDTADGIQIQYFRNGRKKAKIGYSKGFRTGFLEEYNADGKLIGAYPELIVTTKDEYSTKGLYSISLALSDKSNKVRYYKGDLSAGVFDTVKCIKINSVNGIAKLNLKKSSSPADGSVGVIAEILTNYGNNRLVYKKIDLPYNDLK